LQFSQDVPDPVKLLELSEHIGLEGMVSNGRNFAFRSGPTHDWIKVKTAA
jgi:ATP-dependent DNA ligase